MPGYTLAATIDKPYVETLSAARRALADQGFGILTEIDITATLKTKLGVDVPQQVILGACQPPLALRAIEAEPSIATVLPCNVVVRAQDVSTTVVEAFDPGALVALGEGDATLTEVAAEAKAGLVAAIAALTKEQ